MLIFLVNPSTNPAIASTALLTSILQHAMPTTSKTKSYYLQDQNLRRQETAELSIM
jgi:hypothetical protein